MALVLASAAIWLACREPRYEGASLSGWLPEFQNAKVERRLLAAEAVRHIGSRAVPYLVRHLQTDPSDEKSRPPQWRIRFLEWLAAHTPLKISVLRYPSPRLQTLAALDALGPDAKEALPTLKKMVEQYPEEPDILFAVARLGEVGVPLLKKSLTNSASHDAETLRLAAQVCLQMRDSRSFALYPELAPDPTFSEYLARLGRFHATMMQLALADYRAQHPQLSNNMSEIPSSTEPFSAPSP